MQHLMINITGGCYYYVRTYIMVDVTDVVLVVVLLDEVAGDCLHVVDVAEDGQAHLVVLVHAAMRDLYCCL